MILFSAGFPSLVVMLLNGKEQDLRMAGCLTPATSWAGNFHTYSRARVSSWAAGRVDFSSLLSVLIPWVGWPPFTSRVSLLILDFPFQGDHFKPYGSVKRCVAVECLVSRSRWHRRKAARIGQKSQFCYLVMTPQTGQLDVSWVSGISIYKMKRLKGIISKVPSSSPSEMMCTWTAQKRNHLSAPSPGTGEPGGCRLWGRTESDTTEVT